MLHLAVDHGGEGVLLVLLHGVPHLGDPWTSGVHDVATPLIEQLHFLNGGPEGGKNHNVAGRDS